MASTDARSFPEYAVAHRVTGAVRSVVTLKVITGGLSTLASSISLDGGSFATGPVPVEIGTTGFFTLDLTIANMTCQTLAIKVTSAASNAEDVVFTIYPLLWNSKAGRGASRFEELIRKMAEYMLNQQVNSGVVQTVYCDDSATTSVSGNVTDGDTATRGKLA